jgi:hypothetical protein
MALQTTFGRQVTLSETHSYPSRMNQPRTAPSAIHGRWARVQEATQITRQTTMTEAINQPHMPVFYLRC